MKRRRFYVERIGRGFLAEKAQPWYNQGNACLKGSGTDVQRRILQGIQ